jgi:hypothetical protein
MWTESGIGRFISDVTDQHAQEREAATDQRVRIRPSQDTIRTSLRKVIADPAASTGARQLARELLAWVVRTMASTR